MLFAWDISITADTKEANPKKQDLKLTSGVITKIEVKYPAGCHGMVKVKLLRWGSPLIPLTRGEWLTGDDEPVSGNYFYPLEEAPYMVKFEGCSPDTTYPHTVTVRITVLPKQVASWLPVIERLTKVLKFFGGDKL